MKAYKRSRGPRPGTLVSAIGSWRAMWPRPVYTGRVVAQLAGVGVIVDTVWIETRNHRWALIVNEKCEVGWMFLSDVHVVHG